MIDEYEIILNSMSLNMIMINYVIMIFKNMYMIIIPSGHNDAIKKNVYVILGIIKFICIY